MNLSQLMLELADRGIRLAVHGDRLRYTPKAAVTDELLLQLERHKPTILSILAADDVPLAIAWHTAVDQAEAEGKLLEHTAAGCRRANVNRKPTNPEQC